MLTIDQQQMDGFPVLKVTGRMAFDMVRLLNAHLQTRLTFQPPGVLILDLALVEQVDSSGIGLLVATRNAMNRHMGRLCLCGLQARVRDTFRRMSLLNDFAVSPTLPDILTGHPVQEAAESSALSAR